MNNKVFVLAVIILVFNVLSLDFNNLLDFKANKIAFINILVTILIILITYNKSNNNLT